MQNLLLSVTVKSDVDTECKTTIHPNTQTCLFVISSHARFYLLHDCWYVPKLDLSRPSMETISFLYVFCCAP